MLILICVYIVRNTSNITLPARKQPYLTSKNDSNNGSSSSFPQPVSAGTSEETKCQICYKALLEVSKFEQNIEDMVELERLMKEQIFARTYRQLKKPSGAVSFD